MIYICIKQNALIKHILKLQIMEYSILFVDGTIKEFETREEMQQYMVDTKYNNIVLSGKTEYIRIIQGK